MRVIAGTCRSLPLETLPGNQTRPTTDRIKETLFNMLMPYIPGCRFLDLYAGSGGIGIEALSRGADYACFVENNRQALKVIQKNLIFTKLEPDADVLPMDVVSSISVLEQRDPFDVIFMDPPYNCGHENHVMSRLQNSSVLAEDGIVIIEASKDTDISWLGSMGFDAFKIKEYKTNMHVFARRRIKK